MATNQDTHSRAKQAADRARRLRQEMQNHLNATTNVLAQANSNLSLSTVYSYGDHDVRPDAAEVDAASDLVLALCDTQRSLTIATRLALRNEERALKVLADLGPPPVEDSAAVEVPQ